MLCNNRCLLLCSLLSKLGWLLTRNCFLNWSHAVKTVLDRRSDGKHHQWWENGPLKQNASHSWWDHAWPCNHELAFNVWIASPRIPLSTWPCSFWSGLQGGNCQDCFRTLNLLQGIYYHRPLLTSWNWLVPELRFDFQQDSTCHLWPTLASSWGPPPEFVGFFWRPRLHRRKPACQ